ncbi:MAG: RidA family protein [Dehalococcoidia bacterium]|nr:RidA family protein [Dehalococcoidia bacterium]
MKIEAKLKKMGIELKPSPKPAFSFIGCRQVGNLVWVSGHGPRRADGTWVSGRLGEGISIPAAQDAAKLVAINMLQTLKGHIGDLDRVKQIVKLLCLVNSTPDFRQQPLVANGASDFLHEVFGEAGRHARSSVGITSVFENIPIEIEMIVEVTPVRRAPSATARLRRSAAAASKKTSRRTA